MSEIVHSEGLQFFKERTPGKTLQAARMAYIMRTIAKYWVEAPAAEVKAISNALKKLEPKKRGLTQKNREMLRQLEVPELLAAFMNLPKLLLKAAAKARTPYQKALHVQTAVAIEIFLHLPMRRKN